MRPRPSTAWKQTVSGSISLPSPGCFSPFPHGTVRYRSLRVVRLGEWAPQLHTRFRLAGATQEVWARGMCRSLTRLSRSLVRCSKPLQLGIPPLVRTDRSSSIVLQPQCRNACQLGTTLVWAEIPGSLATTTGILLLPRATEMFQFTRFPPQKMRSPDKREGLPHSEMMGSQPASGSPILIAA